MASLYCVYIYVGDRAAYKSNLPIPDTLDKHWLLSESLYALSYLIKHPYLI